MENNTLSITLSIIGCVTGAVSLFINFYKALNERVKLDIEFDESKTLYFEKLNSYSTYKTNFQGFVHITFINKSLQPITIYSINSTCCNKGIFHRKFKFEKLELILERALGKSTSRYYDMSNQVTLPLKIEPFGVFQGYMFYEFFPDTINEIEKLDFTIKTSRKVLNKTCSITKFKTNENYDRADCQTS